MISWQTLRVFQVNLESFKGACASSALIVLTDCKLKGKLLVLSCAIYKHRVHTVQHSEKMTKRLKIRGWGGGHFFLGDGSLVSILSQQNWFFFLTYFIDKLILELLIIFINGLILSDYLEIRFRNRSHISEF